MKEFLIFIAIASFLTNDAASMSLSECNSKSSSTVCRLANETSACCFVKDATCCLNSDFCCPRGFECDVANSRCIKESLFIPFHLKMELISDTNVLVVLDKKVGKDILCPDNQTMCKETQTCCNLTDGNYGCCPIKNAICCEDKVHCCPHNYKCNPTQGKCDRKETSGLSSLLDSIDWHEKVKGINQHPIEKLTETCPGGTADCPTGTTCCQIDASDWGCCPLPNAVCCEDKIHCCPEDYTCDVKDGRCNKKGQESVPLFKKQASIPKIDHKVQDIVCPDGSSQCPNGSTCCQLESGEYGCCPLPEAVCCSDHLHCCPKDYTCDVADGRCNKGSISIPFFRKIAPTQAHKPTNLNVNFDSNSVVCPDGCSFCPNGNTCCQMGAGTYGCCPLPRAVCCEDHLHCCPQNTQCNVQRQTCDNEDEVKTIVSSWFEKTPSKLLYHSKDEKNHLANDPIICDDKVTTCDPLKICCKMADGTYGCCPYSDGVCCTELSYCCPGGTTCGSTIGECNPTKNVTARHWYRIEFRAEEIKQKTNECPNCVYPNGTCCGSNGLCCPAEYTCNEKDESCTLNDPDGMIKAHKIVKINRLYNDSPLSSVQCADSVHFCPDASTCCKTSTSEGTYGCCPVKDAICCADGVNCCPNGYKCVANSQEACVKDN